MGFLGPRTFRVAVRSTRLATLKFPVSNVHLLDVAGRFWVTYPRIERVTPSHSQRLTYGVPGLRKICQAIPTQTPEQAAPSEPGNSAGESDAGVVGVPLALLTPLRIARLVGPRFTSRFWDRASPNRDGKGAPRSAAESSIGQVHAVL